MYKIEKKDFGYKLTFSDNIEPEEMKKWVEESKSALFSAPKNFGVFVDMRSLKPLKPEAEKYMQEGQKLYKDKGMVRSVVIVANAIMKLQFTRIAKETGIYQWERYIDAEKTQNWEQVGINWIVKGIDPDKK